MGKSDETHSIVSEKGGVLSPAGLRAMQEDEGNHMRSTMGRASREFQVTHTPLALGGAFCGYFLFSSNPLAPYSYSEYFLFYFLPASERSCLCVS